MNKVPIGGMAIVRTVLAHGRLWHKPRQIASESCRRIDISASRNLRTYNEDAVVESHISELERVEERRKILVLVKVLLRTSAQ